MSTSAGSTGSACRRSGQRPAGRDLVADGRARTFLPLVPPAHQRPVDPAVVVPLRRRCSYAADGSIADLDGWAAGARPRRPAARPARPRSRRGLPPVTCLLDPALVDAVAQPRRRQPAPRPSGRDARRPEATRPPPPASPDATARRAPATAEARRRADAEPGGLARGQDWLDRAAGRAPPGHAGAGPALRRRRRRRRAPPTTPAPRRRAGPAQRRCWPASTSTPTPRRLPRAATSTPPASRRRPRRQCSSPTALLGAEPAPGVGRTVDGRRVVVTSSAPPQAAPARAPRSTLSALRQRMLAEAAVRAARARPAAARRWCCPPSWDLVDAARFFSGLDVAVARPRPLGDVARRAADPGAGHTTWTTPRSRSAASSTPPTFAPRRA